jgi:ribokinase
MSSAGSYYFDGTDAVQFAGYKVDAVDTVAAGDAFNGGFAAAFSEGKSLEECLQWANACGALSTTKPGAQPSMPTREDLLAFINKNPR